MTRTLRVSLGLTSPGCLSPRKGLKATISPNEPGAPALELKYVCITTSRLKTLAERLTPCPCLVIVELHVLYPRDVQMSCTSLHRSARAGSSQPCRSWSWKALEAAGWFPPSISRKWVRKRNRDQESPLTRPAVSLVLLTEPRAFEGVC